MPHGVSKQAFVLEDNILSCPVPDWQFNKNLQSQAMKIKDVLVHYSHNDSMALVAFIGWNGS